MLANMLQNGNSWCRGIIGAALMCFGMSASAFSSQEVINWNYNGRAAGAGTGCPPGSIYFIEAGNEISVVFSDMAIYLDGSNSDRVARKSCRFVIPAEVKAGWYIGELDQTVTWGYERTGSRRDTKGSLTLTSEFFNQRAGFMRENVPVRRPGPHCDANDCAIRRTVDKSRWAVPGWCGQRFRGNYKANLTIAGKRRSLDQDLVIQVDGEDIRFYALGNGRPCRR